LDQVASALYVSLQGTAASGLAGDTGVSAQHAEGRRSGKECGTVAEINTNVYATQPTRFTLFMRTFLPWQIWRFFSINLRMMKLIVREKRLHK